MDRQKSAEAIVVATHGDEGPNGESRTASLRSMKDEVADNRAVIPERRFTAGGSTAEGRVTARQVFPVRDDRSGDGSMQLMEEVDATHGGGSVSRESQGGTSAGVA